MLSTGGMVVTLKFSSLKHNVPSNLSVVLEMYTANPRKSGVNLLVEPEMKFTMIAIPTSGTWVFVRII